MAGRNDIMATAGLDLSEIEGQLQTLNNRLQASEEKANRAAEKRAKETKQRIGIALGAAGTMFTAFTGANVALGDTNELLQKNKLASLGMANAAGHWSTNIRAGAIAMTDEIPVVGQFAKLMLGTGMRQERDAIAITKQLGTQAESYETLIEKRKQLIAMRATERDKPEGSRSTPDSVQKLSKGILEVDEKIAAIGEKRMELQQEQNAGREQAIAIYELELETAQRLAEVDEKAKNVAGITDAAAGKTFAAQKVAIREEAEQKKRLIELSRVQEVSEKGRLEAIRDTGITHKDELLRQDEAIEQNEIILRTMEKQGMQGTLMYHQAQEQGRQLKLNNQEFKHAYELEKETAENNTKALESQLAGNRKLSELEKNRAQYAMQIAEAMRHGKDNLAEQLRRQERLNELEIKAGDLLKTPQQRQEERKEQEKFDQAQRTVASNEKDRRERADKMRRGMFGAKYRGMTDDQILGRVDARDHISKATAQRRAEFAAMQKQGPNGANPANMALQNITATTIVVTALKTK